jgi:RHS repeat-associated protein
MGAEITPRTGYPDLITSYTWGLDLSGSLEGAGTIGGLLAVETAGGDDYAYTYDANGNVGQLVDLSAPGNGWSSTRTYAHYEYDPYGNVVASGGASPASNPWRFSTKYWDAGSGDTGFGYWGYRYYRADLGRWLNRDPMEEDGGINLYSYAANRPVGSYDYLGLCGKYGPNPRPEEHKACADCWQTCLDTSICSQEMVAASSVERMDASARV